jgi:hypothetical protein
MLLLAVKPAPGAPGGGGKRVTFVARNCSVTGAEVTVSPPLSVATATTVDVPAPSLAVLVVNGDASEKSRSGPS